MNKAFLLTGGNLGDRMVHLDQARRLIEAACGSVTARSSCYETEAWGRNDQPAFLNQALELHTRLGALALLHHLLEIETKMGRVREEKYGPRLIDIDILLFNEEIHDEPSLNVPHPQLANRRFALTPLAEIAGDQVHPVLKKTISELLRICPDTLEVEKFIGC